MNILSIDGAAVALKDGFLFEELCLGIEEGDRIGLVGRNGAGKSTLLRLLSGELEADRGVIARKRGLSVSVLPQRPAFEPGWSLADFLHAGEGPGFELLRRREELHHHELEESGALALELRYASYCTELGLDGAPPLMGAFSGGMVRKAALARCLAPDSDLVLLDEPTNHLDLETIEWLERRLLGSRFAFVLVTHDRWFLDATALSILEIERRRVHRHPGDYTAYLRRKAERWSALEKAENRRLANLKVELAWLGRGARARAGKSERRKDLIRDMQAAGLERDPAMERFSSIGSRLGRRVVELVGASKAYGDKVVLAPFSYEFTAGERVGVVGPNGSGKTTLLDLVGGRIEPDSGRVRRGETLRVGYFDQTGAAMDGETSVLDFVREHAERIKLRDGTEVGAEQLLERFLFPRDFQGLPLSRLSGGERRRLQLVRLLAESPNFLMLDEPTNDLDIETIELLEDFLDSFEGCVLVVSHDRAFLDRVADELIVLDGEGGAVGFPGGYSDWKARSESRGTGRGAVGTAGPAPGASAGSAAAKGADPASAGPGAAPGAAPGLAAPRRLSFKERRELEGLLDAIAALEEERAALEAFFAEARADPAAMERSHRRYAELLPLIEERTLRWEELASRDDA